MLFVRCFQACPDACCNNGDMLLVDVDACLYWSNVSVSFSAVVVGLWQKHCQLFPTFFWYCIIHIIYIRLAFVMNCEVLKNMRLNFFKLREYGNLGTFASPQHPNSLVESSQTGPGFL